MPKATLLLVSLLGLAGCQPGPLTDDAGPPPPSPTTAALPTTTTTIALPATTAAPRPVPPTTTTRPATTTTRAVSRAEATSKLCAQIRSGDEAVQEGRFVPGGLRLGSGISGYGKTADPAVVEAAKRMLRSGLDGDPEGYATARRGASEACQRAGSPILLSGQVQCVRAPCP